MQDHTDPFVPGTSVHIEGTPGGPLAGLTFAAKDLFDVAGLPTGAGNPDWPSAPVPTAHAWLVGTLLDAGATLIGKTITDEVSLGIFGENAFHGTPLNPRAPDRVPGGSSSGSASAVAQGLCELAIGTDTGGSVRVPASFCGLYGIRPTHGRIDLSGMLRQAPSSDTAGWFARDAQTFTRVSEVVLGEPPAPLPTRLLIAADAFGLADAGVRDALAGPVARLAALIGEAAEVTLAPPGLSTWARAQRTLQPYEGWLQFRDWLERDNPRMAFSVARGLAAASAISAEDRLWAAMMRDEAVARMRHLLGEGTVLCLPTTPFPAPPKRMPVSLQTALRTRMSCLTSHGGLTGVPQVSVPAAVVDGRPVGLSIIAARGADAALVATASAFDTELAP